ncbi:DUF1016 N-terminal domain-containing protein [Pinibacter aurantiacus]
MEFSKSIINDIKDIILTSRENAIRAVDRQRTLMYWHIGKRIFEKEQQGKDRADYGTPLQNSSLTNWYLNMELGFSKDKLNYIASFIEHFQLRIQCIRN